MTLVPFAPLPPLAVTMTPTIGVGIVEHRLLLHPEYASITAFMADYRDRNAAERLTYRYAVWMKPVSEKEALLLFVPSTDRGCKHVAIGRCPNDPLAAQVALANSRAGRYMPGIRWELFEDPLLDDLIAMGRFDQWDFLRGIDAAELTRLEMLGVKPQGNWDFDGMIWKTKCCGCGDTVGVNYFAFNIDSAVCANCGNRPYLAPALARSLALEDFGSRRGTHALQWLLGVGAQASELRLAPEEFSPTLAEKVMAAWRQSLGGRVLDPTQAGTIRALITTNSGGMDPGMFESGARMVEAVLLGTTPYTEAHRLAANLVFATAELVEQKLLTTSDD